MSHLSSRITGGALAGRTVRVAGAHSPGFRPSAARLREALFNILGSRIVGARVADLYAGTGLVGIEAISRGAAFVVFVEASRTLARALRESLEALGIESANRVIAGRLPRALERLEGVFDIVFLDPPYDDPAATETLAAVSSKLAAGGLVVYEHSSRYNPPERPGGLQLVERRVYGDSAVGLYSASESA